MPQVTKTMEKAVTDPEVVRLLLSGLEQIRVEVGKLARITAALEVRTSARDERSAAMQASIQQIHKYTVECPARGGWTTLKEDLSEIRNMVVTHDRELAEGVGYRAGKAANRGFKDTPKRGHDTRSLPPNPEGLSVSLAVRDPKTLGKIAFYVLGAAAAAATGFLAQYL